MANIKINGGNYITDITRVDLDSSFVSNLNDQLDHIDENFKKLVSLPFVKGAHGEDVVTETISLGDENGLTELGQSIFKSIYGSQHTKLVDEHVDNDFGGDIAGTESWNFFKKSLEFYKHKEKNDFSDPDVDTAEVMKYISREMYFFIDNRIGELKDYNTATEYPFQDLSCGLIVTATRGIDASTGREEGNYNFNVKKINIFPALHYDKEAGKWCWNLYGRDTNIIAQGVEGQAGRDSRIFVCTGTPVPTTDGDDYTRIVINDVLQPVDTTPSDMPDGSLAVVWFNKTINSGNETTSKLDCTFGIVYSVANNKAINMNYTQESSEDLNYDILTMVNDITLRSLLDDIANTESDDSSTNQTAVRGVYELNKYTGNASISDNADTHMAWTSQSNDDVHLNIGAVKYNDTFGSDSQPSNHGENGTKLTFYYDTIDKDDNKIKLGRTTNETIEYKDINYTHSPTNLTVSQRDNRSSKDLNDYIKIETPDDGAALTASDNTVLMVGSDDSQVNIQNGDVFIKSGDVAICNGKIDLLNVPEDGQKAKKEIISFIYGAESPLNDNNISILNKDTISINSNTINTSSNFLKYVTHNANRITFNYDYIKENGYKRNIVLSPRRPRYLNKVPMELGGYCTFYGSETSNSPQFDKSKTNNGILTNHKVGLGITMQDSWKRTVLSGKLSYTDMLENQGSPFILPKDNVWSNSEIDAGLITSYSAIWTKIGSVVDVKGKIFFTLSELNKDSDGNYSIGDKKRALSYAQLQQLLTAHDVAFPIPLYIKDKKSDDTEVKYISTGNVMSNSSSILPTLSQLTPETESWPSSRTTPSNITSLDISVNDLLNGTANIHLYGEIAGPNSNVELQKQVFSISCPIKTYKTTSSYFWKMYSIPDYDSITSGSNGDELMKNNNGPIKFGISASNATAKINIRNDISADSLSFGNIPSPELNNTYYGPAVSFENTSVLYNTSKYRTVNPLNIYNISTDRETDSQRDLYSLSVAARRLYPRVNIGSYKVRYISFAFSYLLDDDIYPFDNPDTVDSTEWRDVAYTGEVQTRQQIEINRDIFNSQGMYQTGSGDGTSERYVEQESHIEGYEDAESGYDTDDK